MFPFVAHADQGCSKTEASVQMRVDLPCDVHVTIIVLPSDDLTRMFSQLWTIEPNQVNLFMHYSCRPISSHSGRLHVGLLPYISVERTLGHNGRNERANQVPNKRANNCVTIRLPLLSVYFNPYLCVLS